MKCLETDGVNLVDFGFYDSSEYTNTLSIMFWIKVLEKVPSNCRFFGRLNGFNIGTDANGALRCFIRRKDTTLYNHVSNKKLSWDLWTHIAITYQNDGLFLYVNGYGPYIYSFNDNKNEIEKTAATKLSLGGLFSDDNVTPTYQCKCRVSDLSLWNIPLTQEIIGKHMRNEIDTTTNGLLHYWKINEGNGTKINDCVGNINGIVPTTFKWVDETINLKGKYQDDLIWLGNNFSETREKSKDCRGQIFYIKKPFYIEGISIPAHFKEPGDVYIVLAKFRPKGSTDIPQGKPSNVIAEWNLNIKAEQSGVFIIPTTPILLDDINSEYIIYNWFLGKRDIMYHENCKYEDNYFKIIGSIYSSTAETPQAQFTWTIWNDSTAKAYINGFLVGENLIPQKLFLMIDGNEIKTWDGVSFVKIGELPLTEDMFLNYAVTEIPNSRIGILTNEPEIVVYSPIKLNSKNIVETFIPKEELILGSKDYILEGSLSRINIDVNTIGNVIIKFIISIDEGNSWYWFDGNNFTQISSIDINNISYTSNTAVQINSIAEDKWISFIGTSNKIRLGIYINSNDASSIATINEITLFYR